MEEENGRKERQGKTQVGKRSQNSGVDCLTRLLGKTEGESSGDGFDALGVGRIYCTGTDSSCSSRQTSAGGIAGKLISQIESQIAYHQSQIEALTISLHQLKSIKEE